MMESKVVEGTESMVPSIAVFIGSKSFPKPLRAVKIFMTSVIGDPMELKEARVRGSVEVVVQRCPDLVRCGAVNDDTLKSICDRSK